jgi:hypothetical protein
MRQARGVGLCIAELCSAAAQRDVPARRMYTKMDMFHGDAERRSCGARLVSRAVYKAITPIREYLSVLTYTFRYSPRAAPPRPTTTSPTPHLCNITPGVQCSANSAILWCFLLPTWSSTAKKVIVSRRAPCPSMQFFTRLLYDISSLLEQELQVSDVLSTAVLVYRG